MDTSLNLASVRSVVSPLAEGVAKRPDSGRALPANGQSLPPSAVPRAVTSANPDSKEGEELSRIAKALVAEFDPVERIERTEQALDKLNEIMRDRERDLEFSIDEVTGRTILKVIHAESGEVIRQIPPEELLNITRTFIEGTGSLINDEA
jgi:flagellar protein FlaG